MMRNKPLLIFSFILLFVVVVVYKINFQSQVAGVSDSLNWDKARVLVVPHHGFADELIKSGYSNMPEDYEYVVLLGPNHFHPQSDTIILSDSLSTLNIDGPFVHDMFEHLGNASIDNEMVLGDHSILLQVPYIQEYFPDAQVLALLISPYYDMDEVEDATAYLYNNLPQNTLFIASVDFSHETLQVEAMRRNEESIEAIAEFDYKRLASFDDYNMDSPLSIIMVSKLAKLYGAEKWQTLHSSHASFIENDNSIRGTSYVVGGFVKSEE